MRHGFRRMSPEVGREHVMLAKLRHIGVGRVLMRVSDPGLRESLQSAYVLCEAWGQD